MRPSQYVFVIRSWMSAAAQIAATSATHHKATLRKDASVLRVDSHESTDKNTASATDEPATARRTIVEIDAIAEKLRPVLDAREYPGASSETRTTLVIVVISERIASLLVESPSRSSLMIVRMVL